MCISHQTSAATGVKYNHTSTLNLATERTFRQPMKPMLPRKLTSSARINLNQYWNILEDLVLCSAPMMVHPDTDHQMDMSNEINENLANERKETQDLAIAHEDKKMDDSCPLEWNF